MGDRTIENYQKIRKAFNEFGMSLFDMTEENFLTHPSWDVFTFGKPPVAIDIMVKVKGLDFEDCFKRAVHFQDNELSIRTIHKDDLIKAKKTAGRQRMSMIWKIYDLEKNLPVRCCKINKSRYQGEEY